MPRRLEEVIAPLCHQVTGVHDNATIHWRGGYPRPVCVLDFQSSNLVLMQQRDSPEIRMLRTPQVLEIVHVTQ